MAALRTSLPAGAWKGGDKELSSLFANALNLAKDPAEQVRASRGQEG
jgi:hypothetical protein